MSDDSSPAVEEQKKKRGRPAKGDKGPVKESKKRGRPSEKNNVTRPVKSDNEDDAPPGPVKRGRGRPKGSHKRKQGPPKGTAPATNRGRGRPKKVEDKPESTGEEEDEQEEEEEEEEI